MDSSWNTLRLFFICFILSIQYSFNGASPLWGPYTDRVTIQMPFVVSLTKRHLLPLCGNYVEKAHYCGGTLITRSHVLTAAHCVNLNKEGIHSPEDIGVKTGVFDLRARNDLSSVSSWLTFEKYCTDLFPDSQLCNETRADLTEEYYDIAIIKPVSDYLPVATLSYIPNNELYGRVVMMGGWGELPGNPHPRFMRLGRATILQADHCTEQDNPDRTYPDLCTDTSMAVTGPGDSGGPVLYDPRHPDLPNKIVAVIASNIDRDGIDVDIHMSVHFFKEFIEYALRST